MRSKVSCTNASSVILLRVRKAGKLPRAEATGQRLSSQEMDPYTDGSEVSSRLITLDYGLTLDELLCSPEAVAEFDKMATEFSPGFKPFHYRWAALALRKRATTKRFRTAASEQFKHWKAQKAPRRRALSQQASKQYARPAVYALYDGKFPVYVGETRNLKQRIEHLLESEMWSRFNVDTIRIWDVAQELDQFALRSFLVTTQQPLLNSDFLVCDATNG